MNDGKSLDKMSRIQEQCLAGNTHVDPVVQI